MYTNLKIHMNGDNLVFLSNGFHQGDNEIHLPLTVSLLPILFFLSLSPPSFLCGMLVDLT